MMLIMLLLVIMMLIGGLVEMVTKMRAECPRSCRDTIAIVVGLVEARDRLRPPLQQWQPQQQPLPPPLDGGCCELPWSLRSLRLTC